MFTLMNFIADNPELTQIQLYAVLTQGIRTIFIDQLPVFQDFRKGVITCAVIKVYCPVFGLKGDI
jgi:hypothetical protein